MSLQNMTTVPKTTNTSFKAHIIYFLFFQTQFIMPSLEYCRGTEGKDTGSWPLTNSFVRHDNASHYTPVFQSFYFKNKCF